MLTPCDCDIFNKRSDRFNLVSTLGGDFQIALVPNGTAETDGKPTGPGNRSRL
jgi:hypothetical protein